MKLKLITEVNTNDLIVVTPEWMSKTYNEMNEKLFNGVLGACKFDVFTTGRGMNGGTLGWFKIGRNGLKYRKSTRRMFVYDSWGDEIWVNRDNFVSICNPTIELNGNYKWTEKAALSTMVHEMCHYYCEMNGYVPKQAHGVEFREIAQYVSNKSDGFFTVQRLASAEQMNEMELNSDIKARVDQRKENKINKIIPMLVFNKNGVIELINCNNDTLVDYILNRAKDKSKLIITVNDIEFKKFLFSNGYGKAMTTYRYWDVTNTNWINNINQYKLNVLYVDDIQSYMQPQVSNSTPDNVKPTFKNEPERFNFKINLNSGPFELKNVTEEELVDKLREHFPKWSDTALEQIANNKKYRQ